MRRILENILIPYMCVYTYIEIRFQGPRQGGFQKPWFVGTCGFVVFGASTDAQGLKGQSMPDLPSVVPFRIQSWVSSPKSHSNPKKEVHWNRTSRGGDGRGQDFSQGPPETAEDAEELQPNTAPTLSKSVHRSIGRTLKDTEERKQHPPETPTT